MNASSAWLLIGTSLLIVVGLGFAFQCPPHQVTPSTAWLFSPLGLLFDYKTWIGTAENYCTPFHPGAFTTGYVSTFGKTLLIEAPCYLVLSRRSGLLTGVAILITADFLTHPLVYFAFPCATRYYLTGLLFAEAFAFLAEIAFMLWLKARGIIDASSGAIIVLTALANFLSWQIGVFW